MSVLMLDPHGDDLCLFGAFTAIREHAHILVTHATVPEDEIAAAFAALGVSFEIGTNPSDSFDRVIPPAWQQYGHEGHNAVAEATYSKFPATPSLSGYLTYAPRGQRSRDGVEVKPEPEWIARKLAALACFRSQIADPKTRPWFFDLLDLREWIVP